MSLVYTVVTPGDVHLKKMEDTLQSAILAAGHVCAEAVKNIVANNITKAEQFHVMGTKENIEHSQKLLGSSPCCAAMASIALPCNPVLYGCELSSYCGR